MDVMPNSRASSCWSSVSTFPKTMSPCCSEAASYIGANCLHGPHQDAQKSRRTMPSLTVSLKFSMVMA